MARRPVLTLFEFSNCGVSIGWSLASARTVALKAIVDIVTRFLAIPGIERIQLTPRFEQTDAISATSLDQFAAVAGALIRSERCRDPNELRLNGRDTGFEITHLNQSTSGFHCQLSGPCTDEARDRFYETVLDVLREHEAATPEIDFDFGPHAR